MTEDWPSGLLYKVIETKNEKYRPKDMTPRVMKKGEVNTVALKASKDPDNSGTNISSLKIEYKHNLSEEDKVAALVRGILQ